MEIWKDIKGFEGRYKVSNKGNVYSDYSKRNLKPKYDRKGYCKVSLCVDGKSYSRKIHRLVAEAFVSNPENKPQVNHKNGVKDYNFYENLEWVTCYENIHHAMKNGAFPHKKLEKEDVIRIRERYANEDITYEKLADEEGLSFGYVGQIINRKKWKHLKQPERK